MRDQTFADDFRTQFDLLMRLRRDVRRFRTDPVDEAVLTRCLDTFRLAPSVGLSEPWRVIRVDSAPARTAALENFRTANATETTTRHLQPWGVTRYAGRWYVVGLDTDRGEERVFRLSRVQGQARPESLIAALTLAREMAQRRQT